MSEPNILLTKLVIEESGYEESLQSKYVRPTETAAAAAEKALKRPTNELQLKPTISRHWESEEKLVRTATERIAGLVDNAKASISNTKIALPKNSLEFGKPDTALYDTAEKTRLAMQKLNLQRLDGGNLDGLTKAGVRLQSELGKVQADIFRINNALKQTSNKTLIDELNNDLVRAQDNFDKLSSRQALYEKRTASATGAKSSGKQGGGRGRITDAQATVLELADDFAPEGFNRPFNAAAKGMLAVNAASTATLATFGAIAAVGYGIVKVSENIRSEAERRLKVEESIVAASNKQLLAQKASLDNLKELRANDAADRAIAQNLKTASPDELKARRVTTEKLLSLNPAGPNAERFKDQIREIDARLAEIPVERNKLADEVWKKSIEDRKKAENGENEKQKQRITQTYQSALNDSSATADKLISNLSKLRSGASGLKGDDAIKLIEPYEKALKGLSEKLNNLKNETRDFLISVNPSDNPLVKLMSDFDTATERAGKKFADFKKVLNPQEFKTFIGEMASLEQNSIGKKIAGQVYENQRAALGYEQDAVRVGRIKDTQFASFQQAIETVERKVDFAVKINELNRQIEETNFYASKYNPNNPKSFDETKNRFAGDDSSIRSALEDVSALKKIDVGKTGIYGQSAVAGEILKILPTLADLTAALNNPKLAGDARFLLNQRSNALQIQKEFESQKLKDFLYDQETAGLNRKFAYEQIDLLNQQKGLTEADRAKRFLDITKSLGNDIDPQLRRGIYEQSLIAAADEREKQDKAAAHLKAIAEGVKALSEKIDKIVSANGLKINAEDLSINLTVENGLKADTSKTLPKTPSDADTGKGMGLNQYRWVDKRTENKL